MADTNFSEIAADIVIDTPGVPEAVAVAELRKVIREFAAEAVGPERAAIDEELTIDVVEDQEQYTLTSAYDWAEVIVPLRETVEYNNVQIYPVTGYTMETRTTFEFVNTPPEDLAEALVMRVAVRPTASATDIDETFFTDYRDAWAHGLTARLKAQSNKSWTDPDGAGYHGRIFYNKMHDVRARVLRAGTTGRMTVRPRYNFVPNG